MNLVKFPIFSRSSYSLEPLPLPEIHNSKNGNHRTELHIVVVAVINHVAELGTRFFDTVHLRKTEGFLRRFQELRAEVQLIGLNQFC